MSNSADNSNIDELSSKHSSESTAEQSAASSEDNSEDLETSAHDPTLETGIDALLATEKRNGILASSLKEEDGEGVAREVFAPAVVFGDLNAVVLNKIEGEICRYSLQSFAPVGSSVYEDGEVDPEAARARREAITMRYGSLEQREEYRSTFTPIERVVDDEDDGLGNNLTEVSERDGADEEALIEEKEDWSETCYSDEFIREITGTTDLPEEKTEFSVKPFAETDFSEPLHPIDVLDGEVAATDLIEEDRINQEFSPSTTLETETIDAIDDGADNDALNNELSQPELVESLENIDSEEISHPQEEDPEIASSEDETIELERNREEIETIELRRRKEILEEVPQEGTVDELFAPIEEQGASSEELSAPEAHSEETDAPEGSEGEVVELDASQPAEKHGEPESEGGASRPANLAGTMRLEAVTYVDDDGYEGEHQPPPPIRARGSDPIPAIPAQGPPPKHRPLPKEPSVAPPAPRSGRKGRPAGPPPKRRNTGEMRVEGRTPPALSMPENGRPPTDQGRTPAVTGPAPKRPPAQGPPNRPPQGSGVRATPPGQKAPVVVASKSSGDPQMDEIIQQLIDENKQKEVASAEPGAAQANARVEWFTNYFGDDYLRSISPKQQQRTKREIEFMLRSLRPSPGASLLDAACGYGRHSLEFAQRGYEVVGVDLSMTMLKRALNESNKRSAQLKKNLSVRFMQGDMRDIDYQSEFDCALLWQDSLGYFDNLGDADAINKIFNSLKPGGRFLLDVTNRDYVVPLLPTRRIWFGVQAEIHEEVFFDSQTSLLFMKRTYLTNNRGVVRDYLSRIRLYSLHELLNLLRYIGFNILEISGDILYRGHHLDHCSPRNIILAERPK